MPTLLSIAGLKHQIPESVQGRDLSDFLANRPTSETPPKGALYIKNVNGDKNAEGKVISYFPASRGIKTERYTMAITIDRKKEIKEILFFDDINDPYQMKNLSINEHKEAFASLCRELGTLLKNADDPWYREKTLNHIIKYE